jgi:hypothetical protein
MSDPRDYSLDLSSQSQADKNPSAPNRPFLSVQFACCGVYQRVYRDKDAQHYNARCPRCGKSVRFAVGDGGSDSRFFVVK